MKALYRLMMALALVSMLGFAPAALAEAPNEAPGNPAAAQAAATQEAAPAQQADGGSCTVQAEPAEAAVVAPGPILGNPCPNNTCHLDSHCGLLCTVPGCAWPCGACVWETSQACSGVCVCR